MTVIGVDFVTDAYSGLLIQVTWNEISPPTDAMVQDVEFIDADTVGCY
jgi:hypothetical protein